VVDLFRYRHWDLVSKRGIYYFISIAILLVGMVALFSHGLNKGIDFKGGGSFSYDVASRLPEEKSPSITADIHDQLKAKGIDSNVVVSPGKDASAKDQVLVSTLLPEEKNYDPAKESAAITPIVNSVVLKYLPANVNGIDPSAAPASKDTSTAPAKGTNASSSAAASTVTNASSSATSSTIGKTTTPATDTAAKTTDQPAKSGEKMVVALVGKEQVSGTISQELQNKGVLAAIFGSVLILLWIWLRYNIGGLGYRYAVTGIVALVHDLLTLIGMVALLRVEVNAPFVAALLTVLGFSVHDTIVIFDRIRENIRLRKGRTFAETVNISLLETLARSVNTVLTVEFTLLALLFFGGPSLKPFVIAMIIGVTVGAYSSIFVASQLLVSWAKGKDKEILPEGELAPIIPSERVVAATPQPVAAGSGAPAPMPIAAPAVASQEAIQRAKQSGKTSKRRR